MEERDYSAAIKLSQNLIASLEPDDALQFAALVLARVCHDGRLAPSKGLELTMSSWMQIALDFQAPTAFVNCQCGASTEARSGDDGLTIIHSSIACPGFKTKFTGNPRVHARDHAGWSNDQSAAPTPVNQTIPDEASVRFGLIEFK